MRIYNKVKHMCTSRFHTRLYQEKSWNIDLESNIMYGKAQTNGLSTNRAIFYGMRAAQWPIIWNATDPI